MLDELEADLGDLKEEAGSVEDEKETNPVNITASAFASIMKGVINYSQWFHRSFYAGAPFPAVEMILQSKGLFQMLARSVIKELESLRQSLLQFALRRVTDAIGNTVATTSASATEVIQFK